MAKVPALFTADRRLYLNAEGEAVEADDPNRITLLAAKGTQFSMSHAQQLGLAGDDGAPLKPKKASAKKAKKVENKAAAKPENKSA